MVTQEYKAIERLIDILNPLVITSQRGYAYEVEGMIVTKWCRSQSGAEQQLRRVIAGYLENRRRFDRRVAELNADEDRIRGWLYALSRKSNARRIAAAELHFNKSKYVSLVMQEEREKQR